MLIRSAEANDTNTSTSSSVKKLKFLYHFLFLNYFSFSVNSFQTNVSLKIISYAQSFVAKLQWETSLLSHFSCQIPPHLPLLHLNSINNFKFFLGKSPNPSPDPHRVLSYPPAPSSPQKIKGHFIFCAIYSAINKANWYVHVFYPLRGM